MKIAILNGNPGGTAAGFEAYLAAFKGALEDSRHEVALINLRDLDLKHCIGCWDCWVKTPGECVSRDDGPAMRRAVLGADLVVHASPLILGYPSSLTKKAMDKSIPIIHPYMAIVNGEFHHRARYERYPKLGLLVAREEGAGQADLAILTDQFCRTALNMKTELLFSADTGVPPAELAAQITAPGRSPVPLPANLKARPGVQIAPPRRLTVFNGSPRGAKGNTPIMLREFLKGFMEREGNTFESCDLVHQKDLPAFAKKFSEAEAVLLGFPLYTDAMPGIVKAFIDELAPYTRESGGPPAAFLVQSGFPEAAQSRPIESYLENLAGQLGSPYLGTMVRGNGEGTRLMPDSWNKKLFSVLRGLGRGLAVEGRLDPALLRSLASPERMPGFLMPFVRLGVALGAANGYWNGMLKQNGAMERVWDRPYEDSLPGRR